MPDDRSYEVMADEHAIWLGTTVAHTVGVVLTLFGRDNALPGIVPARVLIVVRSATRKAFLFGAQYARDHPHFALSEMEPTARYHASTFACDAEEEQLAELRGSNQEFLLEHNIETLIKGLVEAKCFEMFLHGAKHALERMEQQKKQDAEER